MISMTSALQLQMFRVDQASVVAAERRSESLTRAVAPAGAVKSSLNVNICSVFAIVTYHGLDAGH